MLREVNDTPLAGVSMCYTSILNSRGWHGNEAGLVQLKALDMSERRTHGLSNATAIAQRVTACAAVEC